MRRLTVLLLVLAGLTLLPTGSSVASCAGPALAVDGTSGERPELFAAADATVTGRFFVDGCDDTGGGSAFGCSAGEDEGEVETPLTDIDLVLRQGGRQWVLGTADAGTADDDRLGQVTWEVRLPRGLEPGRAVLRAGTARLDVTVAGAPGR